jgi:DNA-binding NarL/FixJ family response regulator
MVAAAKIIQNPSVPRGPVAHDQTRRPGTFACPNCSTPIFAAYASEYISDGDVRYQWLCDSCDCDFATVVHEDRLAHPTPVPTTEIGEINHNIRVIVADDHPLVLSGLRDLIQAQADLELVGEASDGFRAVEVITEQKPDVAIVDISMPKFDGLYVARSASLVHPSVRFIALTQFEDRESVVRAFDAGMSGYVLKRSAAKSLVHAITSVFNAGIYVDPAVDQRAVEFFPRVRSSSSPDLTRARAIRVVQDQLS